MAALSYMQRRRSAIYEFRRRLPQELAGKPVRAHIREGFPDLINAKTGRFKREFVRSLDTKEVRQAKTKDHREALKFAQLVDDAVAALISSVGRNQFKVERAFKVIHRPDHKILPVAPHQISLKSLLPFRLPPGKLEE
jgi:hypothetical protein